MNLVLLLAKLDASKLNVQDARTRRKVLSPGTLLSVEAGPALPPRNI